MNVQVLGSDYSQEMMGGNWWDEWGQAVAKVVAPVIGSEVGKRLSPTQKSMVQQVTGTSTSVPANPPKKSFMEENGTYLIIGGAVLLGAIVLMKSRSSVRARRYSETAAPVAA